MWITGTLYGLRGISILITTVPPTLGSKCVRVDTTNAGVLDYIKHAYLVLRDKRNNYQKHNSLMFSHLYSERPTEPRDTLVRFGPSNATNTTAMAIPVTTTTTTSTVAAGYIRVSITDDAEKGVNAANSCNHLLSRHFALKNNHLFFIQRHFSPKIFSDVVGWADEGANEQEGLEGLGIEEMINLRDMVEAGVHLGHSTKIWNALNIHTIFGERNGIHVINLEHTIAALRRAAKVVESIAYNGGIILFVGTRANIRDVVIDAAYSSGQYYVVDRWIPGTLTNSRLMTGQQLMGSESYVKLVPDYQPPKTIKKNTDDGEINTNDGGSGSAELGEEKKKQVGDKGGNSRYMKNTTGQRRGDTEDEDYHVMPDLIVSFNPTDVTNTLLAEAQRCLIPTVGVVDTNFDPRKVTYGIPGNDDSSSSIGYIAKVLSKAAYLGKQRRINQAYKGQ
ncbi:30S ribosomal protein S2 [Zancudomyces culisetae]|uniref:30S ribosomal protein S2 n=1 Tax=Zancudomyces culisetae TaxID=1213189 RepID=A0A1R1PHA2_ZANCU|nr:30S ribosomal protein S2 [Zancudomyces culisetae]|eukprot:OMH80232.1 30S ribosomal protein S2 [Zancudomyces culisetae]